MKSEQLNSYLEVKQKTERDVRQLGVLVSESYEADSTDGQTVINLNFTIDINNKKQIWVFVDGMKLVEGITSNYTFTNIVGSLSSQITLNSPLIAGLPIQVYKIGAYQEAMPNPSSVTATLLNDVAQPHKMAQDAFSPFVKKEFITAPNTTITNRAKVESGALKAIAGVERIHTRSLSLLRDEFGPNGEPVYEIQNKDSRIRLVGSGWTNFSTGYGTGINSTIVGSYLEITFYGTGLNWLILGDSDINTDWRVSIDGGAEGSDIWPIASTVLQNRGYNPNQILNIASGLSLGWHTIKIRHNAGTSSGSYQFGFEVLNIRTDLAVLSGVAYNGMKQEVLNTLNASNFKAGVVGTRGARVIKYLKDGTISQAVTEVNSASAFLTSTDHTNEEIVRKINTKEFGVNRSDDFSTTSASKAAAFTLDDGTTTLVADQIINNNALEGISNVGANFFTLTFVGTGLDIIGTDTSTGSIDSTSISVDGGANQLMYGPTSTLASTKVFKVCSGLPYGTHTVKFVRTASGTARTYFSEFIIYQPKKPTLPIGAIEVSDYCVMADYVANTTTTVASVAQGTLRKFSPRENTYVGTWVFGSLDAQFACGFNVLANVSASYCEYSFFGTGLEYRFYAAAAQNWTVTIDGSSNLSSYATNLYQIGGTGMTFTPSTGTVTGTPTTGYGHGLKISGLALGWHKIRITSNNAASMYIDTFDIITPIHINTNMKVGSLSLRDIRNFSPIVDKPNLIDLSKAKAWVNYDASNSKIISSNNVSQVLGVSAGTFIVFFEKPFKDSNYVMIGTGRLNQFLSEYVSILKTKNSIAVNSVDYNGVTSNQVQNYMVFFGELEDEGEI
jgi:hypothetical protein